MSYVIPPPPVTTLEVEGASARFPVHRIYCIGRNYADHAREMGHDPDREPPFFFMKPADSIVTDGNDFPYPEKTEDVHHEMELVVALGSGGRNIPVKNALDCIFGYAVGLDMTRRDLQSEAKKLGRPWDTGKAFDHSAPCSRIRPVAKTGHPNTGALWLKVNGKTTQSSDISALIWTIPEQIAFLSSLFSLAPGDLIYTGTPAGVGPVNVGDVLHGGVDNVGEIKIKIV